MLLVYAFFQGYILFYSHNLLVIPLFLFTFCLIALPGLLFVAAFSLACPIIMPLPVYQFLFTGYWLWGNLFLKQQILPTLSRSILTPSGVRIAGGFFGTDIDLLGHTSTFEAIASLGLLLCIAILVLLTLWGALRWQQARQ
ncbi:hypothetical protein EPA93_37815 [Ktedonosporobacter rubrisoli]|uniref:Uncharacterized protein n=1 Tax=Ktedonosporobacter rubrisoli TaxID=2509675 RepID=A0A4P6K0E5_KTERU|nr:hypothetical protein [Ktedonosporobacter rubrisoli]QBD81425.1 hypothetical protein EPA93_37815 [Ktedonosporobacter rubrisoli]